MENFTFEDGEVEIEVLSNDNNTENRYSSKSYPTESTANYQRPIRKPFVPPEEPVKIIYTDGGSKDFKMPDGTIHRVGAWSFYDSTSNEIRGKAEDGGTNNQMELMAVLQALNYLDELGISKDKWVKISLDSGYVYKGILFWVKKWITNGWKRYDKDGQLQEVANRDLWEQIYGLAIQRKIFWNQVPGHSGVEGNEKADIKCTQCIQEFAQEHNLINNKL